MTTTWEVEPFSLSLTAPLATAHGPVECRRGFAVRLRSADGHTGLGECTPLVSFGTEDLATAEANTRAALAQLPDRLPNALDAIHDHCETIPTPAARHGVELALLDLASRAAGWPLWKFLGGVGGPLPVNALLYGDVATQARALWADGWTTFKLKLGMEDDVARVQQVRAALPHATLRVDGNAAWDATRALAVLTQLAAFNIQFCEQPTAINDVDGLRWLNTRSPVPIAADESVPSHAEAIIQSVAAKVLILKPMVLGGVLRALRLAQRAHAAGLECVVTSSLDGVVARAGAAHLAAALPTPHLAAGLSTGSLFADEGPDPLMPKRGFIHLPTTPGLLP